MTSLDGKHAFVTGGGRGIGRGIVHALVEAGARVTVADRDGDVAAGVAAERSADRAFAVTVDVANRASIEAAFDLAEASFGPVHIAVANAGILTFAPFLDLSVEELQRHVVVDFQRVFHTAQSAARRMVARKLAGSVIVITSVSAEVRRAREGTTAPSKRER